MRALFTADLHLTDRPDDEYRWCVFEWIRKQISLRKIDYVFILGDLTHFKDNHSAKLTNRLSSELARTAADCLGVIILKGNHDYVEPTCPFFNFLNHIPGITYIVEPMTMPMFDGTLIVAIPHTSEWIETWGRIHHREDADFVLLHQTVEGAVSEAGHVFPEGIVATSFNRVKGHVLAGDIHVPQTVGKLTYIGAPHPINFGDDYLTRVLFFDGKKLMQITHPTIKKSKLVVCSIDELIKKLADFEESDQVKIVVRLPRSDFANWETTREQIARICEERKLRVYSTQLEELPVAPNRVRLQLNVSARPTDTVRRFGQSQQIDDLTIETGVHLIGD